MSLKGANYICRLQEENRKLKATIAEAGLEIRNLRAHLTLPKFIQTDPQGERKDWISTGDVDRMLVPIQNILNFTE